MKNDDTCEAAQRRALAALHDINDTLLENGFILDLDDLAILVLYDDGVNFDVIARKFKAFALELTFLANAAGSAY
jgi:hypothetical protein